MRSLLKMFVRRRLGYHIAGMRMKWLQTGRLNSLLVNDGAMFSAIRTIM